MKKATLLLMLAVSFFFSCSNDSDVIPENVPLPTTTTPTDASEKYDISFTVTNEMDGDVLDPDYHWNHLKYITIEYKNKEYTLLSSSGKVRDDIPIPFKISLTKEEGKNYQLNFGDFDPAEEYKNEKFAIDWYGIPNYMKRDTVSFSLYSTLENNETIVHKELFVNNKPNPEKDEPFLINKYMHSEVAYDFVNYNICFEIKNKEGENLLDPNVKDNILNKITIYYGGKEYKEIVHNIFNTRASYVRPLGIRIFFKENPILAFGEFSPTETYRGVPIYIDWGDGTRDHVTFTLYMNYEKGYPEVYKRLYLNDMLYSKDDFPVIKIIK